MAVAFAVFNLHHHIKGKNHMRRTLIIIGVVMLAQLVAVVSLAQDRLTGRWEGKVEAMSNERDAVATFKKEGDSYTGTITGLRGDTPFKEVKVDGDKITAKAEIESPQGTFAVNYTFTLEGDSLKGKGEVDFNGQTFAFNYNLKRAGSAGAAAAGASAGARPQPPQQARPPQVPQPQQKQSIDYFVGNWTFKFVGRE